jgi:serine/threonine protein kinase
MNLDRNGIRRNGNKMSQKYHLDICNKKIKDSTTRDWVVEGLLNNNMQMVIKINVNKEINEKEYNINQQLSPYKNFVRYICKFSCKDDLRKYMEKGPYREVDDGFCKENGPDRTFSIIMPYYQLGSILKYTWTKENFNIFKTLMKTVIYTLLFVNNSIGFIHGDFHLENILLKEKKGKLSINIIDFELSEIEEINKGNMKKLGKDFSKLFVDMEKLNIIKDITECIKFTQKMRDPFENKNLDINELYILVDSLEYFDYN